MHVVGVQLDIAWHDPPESCRRAGAMLEGANVPPGALIVLPEMFASGFTMDVAAAAADGVAERFLAETARRLGAWVLGGVVRGGADGPGLNQSLLVGPDGAEASRYTKMHPFTFAGEADHYAAGNAPVLADVGDARLAPLVCYDLRFPEVFRSAVVGGAEVYAVIANWPAARAEHWRALLRARAIENQAAVIGVNRTGADPNVTYGGGSLAFGPRGELLAECAAAPSLLIADVEPEDIRRCRREFPVLRDLREDWVRGAPGPS